MAAYGKLALLIVYKQKAVMPAVGAGLVHNRSDVTCRGVEITYIQKRRVMLVAAA